MIGSNWVLKGFWASVFAPKVATGLVAAGTNQATGLVLTADSNMVGTTTLNTGVVLPAITGPGDELFVFNGGANPLSVYGSVAGAPTINAIAGTTAYSIPVGKGALFMAPTANTWVTVLSA